MTASAVPESDRIFLFFYGTLKRGEPGHELLLPGAEYVATVSVSNLRWIEDAEYPSCIETDDGSERVTGEVWSVPRSNLSVLNEYEGENYRLAKLRDSNLHAYLLREREADKFAAAT